MPASPYLFLYTSRLILLSTHPVKCTDYFYEFFNCLKLGAHFVH